MKVTAVAVVKWAPVMVITSPMVPVCGANDEIIGGGVVYVNPPRVSEPAGVLTTTFPEAPEATTALMDVEETTVKEAAGVPPKLTAVAPVRFVPVITTVEPAVVVVGLNEVMIGVVGTV